MDAKLRAFLKRQGVSDAALDKIERGELGPDDDSGLLRKGTKDSPLLEKMREAEDLLEKIKSDLGQIHRADRHREAVAKGFELFQSGKANGYAVQHKGLLQ